MTKDKLIIWRQVYRDTWLAKFNALSPGETRNQAKLDTITMEAWEAADKAVDQ